MIALCLKKKEACCYEKKKNLLHCFVIPKEFQKKYNVK